MKDNYFQILIYFILKLKTYLLILILIFNSIFNIYHIYHKHYNHTDTPYPLYIFFNI